MPLPTVMPAKITAMVPVQREVRTVLQNISNSKIRGVGQQKECTAKWFAANAVSRLGKTEMLFVLDVYHSLVERVTRYVYAAWKMAVYIGPPLTTINMSMVSWREAMK